tara:strand:- start:178 stop:465 length:288 start_codon:yes stop_codon:yes gene_type:complete
MFTKIKSLLTRTKRNSATKQPLLKKKKKKKSKKAKRNSKNNNLPLVSMGPNNFSKKMTTNGGLTYTYYKKGKKKTKFYKGSNLPPILNLSKNKIE